MRFLLALVLGASLVHAQTAGELLSQGDALEAKGRHREALVLYLEADRQSPATSSILRRISRQYEQLGQAASAKTEKKSLSLQALDAARRAVAADSRNAEAHLCLAIAYGRQARFESPRRKVELSRLIKSEAETASRLDPRQDYAWHILGRWNYELASLNPVLKALAQTIYGRFPDASNEKAVAYFQKAVALQPRRPLHHIELGRAYLALRQKDNARRSLQTGLDLPARTADEKEAHARALILLQQIR